MIDLDALDNAVRDYAADWELQDQILYRICEEHPKHEMRKEVCAKVSIIGRTYATGIERTIHSEGTQAYSLDTLITTMHSSSMAIDGVVDRLRNLRGELTLQTLPVVVGEHQALLSVLKGGLLGKLRGTPRSFVSKYLHFHVPVVPLYDSYADSNLSVLMRRCQIDPVELADRLDGDEYYADYCHRFYSVHQHVRRERPNITVKQLDYFLLTMEDTVKA
jgi:hypothetical protein